MDLKNIETPMNANERYLYNINVRLNILIEMMNSFLKTYAEQNKIAVTNNKVVIEPVKKVTTTIAKKNVGEKPSVEKVEEVEKLKRKKKVNE